MALNASAGADGDVDATAAGRNLLAKCGSHGQSRVAGSRLHLSIEQPGPDRPTTTSSTAACAGQTIGRTYPACWSVPEAIETLSTVDSPSVQSSYRYACSVPKMQDRCPGRVCLERLQTFVIGPCEPIGKIDAALRLRQKVLRRHLNMIDCREPANSTCTWCSAQRLRRGASVELQSNTGSQTRSCRKYMQPVVIVYCFAGDDPQRLKPS